MMTIMSLQRFLEPYLKTGSEYSVCMLTTVHHRSIVIVFYNMKDPEKSAAGAKSW